MILPDNSGTVLLILDIYFSLVVLLGSFYLVRLGAWYKHVSTTGEKWKRLKNLDARDRYIECHLEAFSQRDLFPLVGFVLLTGFMLILGVLSEQLKQYIQYGQAADTFSAYLYTPAHLFFVIYFVTALIYLLLGYLKVNTVFKETDVKLSYRIPAKSNG